MLASSSILVNIDSKIKENAIKIRRKYGIKIPDAIISASALSRGLTLVTDDKVLLKLHEIKSIDLESFIGK